MTRGAATSIHAVIVGAGIGGLATAMALARKGIGATICERAPELSEAGAGIQISPNATRLLIGWGLGEALDRVAFRPEAVEARGWKRGNPISLTPLGDAMTQRFGAPYLHIHRADMVGMLADAIRGEPLIDLRLAMACETFDLGGRPALVAADGRKVAGDVLIGADGIHSAVRFAMFGPEKPRFTGNVAWRGVVPATALKGVRIPPVAGLWMGPGAHFVHYYVRRGELVNFVGIVETDDWQEESWTTRGSKGHLMRDFGDWHPIVKAIVNAAPDEGCFRWALFDRDPIPHWGRGATTLLGDACHPTLPFMAQGACMAIEDAAVLAECLEGSGTDEIPERLRRYESLRRDRTAAIQLGSRRNAALYHLRSPLSWARNRKMRAGAGLGAQMEQLYAYDAITAASPGRPQRVRQQ